MGFSVQSVEYMNNTWVQSEGSRALGRTGTSNYWTRITIRTDSAGSTGASIYLDIEGYGGYGNQYYSAGAQAVISTSSSPSSYVGTNANLPARQYSSTTSRWIYSGSVAANLSANTTYYIIITPCWTAADTFARYVHSTPTASSTGDWPSYTLSISEGTGSSVTVYRSASPLGAATGNLTNGSTIYSSDTLTVTFGVGTGYTLGTHTVNGTTQNSGYSWAVSSAASVVSTATPTPYTLDLQPGIGTVIAVSRTSSPIGGGASGILNDGATVYYNDVLTITFSPQTGYTVTATSVVGASQSGDSWTVGANNVTASASADPTEYTLSIVEDTGAIISVSRTASPVGGGASGDLSDGAVVYYSDELSVTFAADDGYVVTTRVINGAAAQSGAYVAPDSDVVIEETTTAYFALTVQKNAGAVVAVSRTASPSGHGAVEPLADGAVVYDGDALSISFSLETGYRYDTKTVNGAAVSGSSASATVASNVAVVGLAAVLSFALTINAGTGSTVTVERTASPKQGAPTGVLASGDTIYYSDALQISFAAIAGYRLTAKTVNGAAVTGESMTGEVTRAIAVVCTAAAIPFLLHVRQSNSGVTTTVFRQRSPIGGASLEGQQLGDGATVYYDDELVLTYSFGLGYALEESTFNGVAFESGALKTVPLGDATVVVLAKASGFVYINNEPYLIHIGNGDSYDMFLAFVGNGSEYEHY